MRFCVAATRGALVLAALGVGSPAVAAGDCEKTGVLSNARMKGLAEGAVCSDAGPLGESANNHSWLPRNGYERVASGDVGWHVSAESEVLPLSLFGSQLVTLDRVRITANQRVDLSYPPGTNYCHPRLSVSGSDFDQQS